MENSCNKGGRSHCKKTNGIFSFLPICDTERHLSAISLANKWHFSEGNLASFLVRVWLAQCRVAYLFFRQLQPAREKKRNRRWTFLASISRNTWKLCWRPHKARCLTYPMRSAIYIYFSGNRLAQKVKSYFGAVRWNCPKILFYFG